MKVYLILLRPNVQFSYFNMGSRAAPSYWSRWPSPCFSPWLRPWVGRSRGNQEQLESQAGMRVKRELKHFHDFWHLNVRITNLPRWAHSMAMSSFSIISTRSRIICLVMKEGIRMGLSPLGSVESTMQPDLRAFDGSFFKFAQRVIESSRVWLCALEAHIRSLGHLKSL